MDSLEIKYHEDQNKSMRISCNREVTPDDLAKVDIRENALLFILGQDDKGWRYSGNKSFFRVRLKNVDDLYKEIILKQPTKNVASIYACDIWKVYTLEVTKNEVTRELEEEFMQKTARVINEAIKQINYLADSNFDF